MLYITIIYMANTTGAEELSGWAQRSLPAKNKLTGADAQLVERAFNSKLNVGIQ